MRIQEFTVFGNEKGLEEIYLTEFIKSEYFVVENAKITYNIGEEI